MWNALEMTAFVACSFLIQIIPRCWQPEPPAVVLGALQFVSWSAFEGTLPAENLPAE